MPQFQNQNIIVTSTEIYKVVRGRAASFDLVIHESTIGNQLNIGVQTNVKVEVVDENNTVCAVFQKTDNTLSVGAVNSAAPGIPVSTTYIAGACILRCRLLYTSDAADDLLCVDLGGRRIIKKQIYLYTASQLTRT